MQTAMTFPLHAEFLEMISDLLGQMGYATRSCTIIKFCIHPQCAEHFDQMRLTRTVKSTDPNAWLLRVSNV